MGDFVSRRLGLRVSLELPQSDLAGRHHVHLLLHEIHANLTQRHHLYPYDCQQRSDNAWR